MDYIPADNFLATLNPEQADAVESTEGYIRVIAGAGSGKTRALTYRYLYLVNEIGVSPSNVLCVTFTNKAANEMKRRIRRMIGDQDTSYVCTFHGFAVKILREDIHTINYPKDFAILDTEDAETILKSVYEDLHIQSKQYTFHDMREYISAAKVDHKAQIPYFTDLTDERLKQDRDREKDMRKKIFLAYLYEQKKSFGLDYDDLITLAVHILENFPEKREKWQKQMMYVMVDEFQDVSAEQYRLADIISGYHKNLFVVGDPDQTIYSWRGSDINYILEFDKKHLGTKTIMMNRNYRSSADILLASNSLIQKNRQRIEKELIPVKPSGCPVTYFHARTTEDEAKWVAKRIRELVDEGTDMGDIAILYRASHVSRNLEEVLVKEKIPYVLYSGTEFYQRKEIKDVLSYLRMIIYPDDYSFLRVVNEPKRNIGKKRITFLKDYAQQKNCSMFTALLENLDDPIFNRTGARSFVALIDKYTGIKDVMHLSDLLALLLSESGYEEMLRLAGEQERLDNLSELKQSIYDYEKKAGEETSLAEYLQTVALFTNMDREERKHAVKMMTVHAAKGLEFPYVFICGMNEGIFPSGRTKTQQQIEEERRVAYVAFTRAEEGLFITDAEGKNYDQSFRHPSRFIFNVDKQYLHYEVELDEALLADAVQYIRFAERQAEPAAVQTEDTGHFSVGDRVVHRILGAGEVTEVRLAQQFYVIKFDAKETERTISFKVPLQKEE